MQKIQQQLGLKSLRILPVPRRSSGAVGALARVHFGAVGDAGQLQSLWDTLEQHLAQVHNDLTCKLDEDPTTNEVLISNLPTAWSSVDIERAFTERLGEHISTPVPASPGLRVTLSSARAARLGAVDFDCAVPEAPDMRCTLWRTCQVSQHAVTRESGKEKDSSCTASVSNVSRRASHEEIRRLFSSIGEVISITRKSCSANRRVFVKFAHASDAWKAAKQLNRASFVGRALTVRVLRSAAVSSRRSHNVRCVAARVVTKRGVGMSIRPKLKLSRCTRSKLKLRRVKGVTVHGDHTLPHSRCDPPRRRQPTIKTKCRSTRRRSGDVSDCGVGGFATDSLYSKASLAAPPVRPIGGTSLRSSIPAVGRQTGNSRIAYSESDRRSSWRGSRDEDCRSRRRSPPEAAIVGLHVRSPRRRSSVGRAASKPDGSHRHVPRRRRESSISPHRKRRRKH